MTQSYPVVPGVRFKEIAEFPGYFVSEDGNIWSQRHTHGYLGKTWKRLKPGSDRTGHYYICLYRDYCKIYRYVHDLVLESFIGPRPEGMQGCHFPDRSPSNNHITNLRWGTAAENAADKSIHGTLLKGEMHGNAKLNNALVLEIRRLRTAGMSLAVISREMKISRTQVHNVVSGRTWSHVV